MTSIQCAISIGILQTKYIYQDLPIAFKILFKHWLLLFVHYSSLVLGMKNYKCCVITGFANTNKNRLKYNITCRKIVCKNTNITSRKEGAGNHSM